MTRHLSPHVTSLNGSSSGSNSGISEHDAPAAACGEGLHRVALLLEELAGVVRDLAGEVGDSLAKVPVQSDVMAVHATHPAITEKSTRSLISVRQVAALVGVSPTTVRRWRRQGKLPEGIELGGVVRWRPEVINAWLEEQEG